MIAHSPNYIGEKKEKKKLFLSSFFANSSDEWRTSQMTLILIWTIPVIVVLLAFISALMGKEMYKLYTGEDGIAETMQVIFYAVAFVLNIFIIRRLWAIELRGIGILYLIVCVGLLFLIGEELSWGQRLLGWETPEALKEINKQKETNLHNIYFVGNAFKWIQMIVGAYGTLLPLLVLSFSRQNRYRETLSLLIPHFTLIPFFLPLFAWRIYRNFFDAPVKYYFVISEFNEVMELILAVGLAFFMLFQYRRLKRKIG